MMNKNKYGFYGTDFDFVSLRLIYKKMKIIKKGIFSILLLIIMASFSQCSSSQLLIEKAPATFGDVCFQRWNAGIQGGGSGINLFIPEMDIMFVLDSVYFRGQSVKLERSYNYKYLYVGNFNTNISQPKDIILSSNPLDEYNNPLLVKNEKFPFTLKDSECVVSYKDGQTTKYFKIKNVIEKEAINYPSAPIN